MTQTDRQCRKCSVNLKIGTTWSQSRSRYRDYICRACDAARARGWTAANPDKKRAAFAKWYAANADDQRASATARYHADPERRYETNKSWRNDNPEKFRASSQRRRAAVVAALSPDRDEAKIAAMHNLAVRLTEKFGTPYHVDHLVPLSKGGMHHESNLVVMRGDYNCSKGAKIIPSMIAFFGGEE